MDSKTNTAPKNCQVASKELNGKVALVTGASRGIGRAIAVALAEQGASVVVCSRTIATLAALTKEIESKGGRCIYSQVDVRLESSVDELLSFTNKEMGKIDILINNAGIYRTEAVDGHSLTTWDDVLSTNLTSALLTSRRVLGGMISRSWGRIINVASISGKVAEAYGAAYSASKFGLIGLTQAMALEVARYGITVNAVCPGWVSTSMASEQLSDESYLRLTEQEPSQASEIARLSVPQERFIEPHEVANLVVYLCSNAARGITGQSINICGGLSLH